MLYDVIVVGAGPAGAVTAYHLAKKQFKVLILDQSPFPRYKPCGGGIPVRTIEELPYDLKPVLEMNVLGVEVTCKGTPKLRISFSEEFAWLAMREKMDHFLLEQAINAGAACRTGIRVIGIEEDQDRVNVKTENEPLYARYIVGADGVNSIVARSLNLLPNRKTGVALEAEIEVPTTALKKQGAYTTFDFGALPEGYGWIFPKQNHLSVGVYYANPSKMSQLKDYLHRFINCQAALQEHKIMSIRGHRIPLGEDGGPLHTKRCLLVGDAANLADPWLGEGIFYAVRSANLASKALTISLKNGHADFAVYSRQVNEEIIEDFKFARRIGKMVFRYPTLATALLSRSAFMQNNVFINIRGEITFQELWKRLFFNFPIIFAQFIFSRKKNNP